MTRSIQGQERLFVGLAMIAGYIDGFGLLTVKTYLSFMSGNTTQTGSNLGRGDFPLAAPSALAIVFFMAGIFLGSLLRYGGWRQSRRAAFGGVGGLLLLVVAGAQLDWLSDSVKIMAVSLAMGIMNTTMSHVGNEQVNLTFVTGILNKMGNHAAMALLRVPLADAQGAWDTQLRRAFLLTSVWAGFFGGAVLAGIFTSRLGGWTLLPPAIILLAMALLARAPEREG